MRLNRLLSIIIILAACSPASASEDPRFTMSGYYKNLLSGSKSTAGGDYYGDLNRLRLDSEYRPSEDMTLKLVLDNEAVFGTVLDTADFKAGKDIRQTYFGLDRTFADTSDLWGRTSVHRFYLTAKSDRISGTLGRQRIAWGTERLWNPTDLFNPASPFSIERDERTGTDAVRLDLYPGPLSGVTAVYAPEREGNDDIAFRAKTNMRGYDVSLVLASLGDRNLAGIDFAGNLGDSSLRGEATYESMKRANPLFPEMAERFSRAVLSWDYTFPNTLYVLLEYLYNGGNVKQDVPLTFVQAGIMTKNRNFLAAGFGYDLTPLIRPECTFIVDVDGKGVFAGPSVKYNVRENVDWVAGVMLFSSNGEYKEQQDVYYTSVTMYF